MNKLKQILIKTVGMSGVTAMVQDKPNVILFLADDMDWQGVSVRQGRINYDQNYPAHAGKESAYEGGSHVPMMVVWPGVVEGSIVNPNCVMIEYFFPTVLEMADMRKYNCSQTIDGKSFCRALHHPDKNYNRTIVWHYPNFWCATTYIEIDRRTCGMTQDVIRQARACNLALEEQTYSQQVGLMNCMAQNILNIDHTLHSSVAKVSIDYTKYNEDMAKSHLFQYYTSTLLQGQTVWSDHDMFHSSDSICGSLMARSKVLSGGPVYLSDSPADFVKENIFPLINEEGNLFRLKAPAIPTAESIFTNPLQSGETYRVFAPTGEEAVSLICYNLNTSSKYRTVQAKISKADYLLRETMTGEGVISNNHPIILYDWAKQTATELTEDKQIELDRFTDRLYHLCPVIDG